MHPSGSELVHVISGRVTLIQRVDGVDSAHELGVGDSIVNPPGVWHTARVQEPATVLFITAGQGTENRAAPPGP